mmetsp:Transcript_11981/g.26026  ORF Transcript_11981/g.26026 Transcript_11981/m.26026 type:complete len:231 (-) Transcript_11981:684-1376(-)
MNDEDLVVDHVAQRCGPEDLCKEIDHALLVLHLQLAKEAIEVVCHLGLVVPAVHVYAVWLPNLECKDGKNNLDAPRATIHKVAVEKELVVWRWKPCQAQHVIEVEQLAMEVANHGDLLPHRHRHSSQGLLLHEDVVGIDSQLVRILHWQNLSSLELCQHLADAGLIQRRLALVARPSMANGIGHGSDGTSQALHDGACVRRRCWRDLVLLDRGILWQVLEALVSGVNELL